MSQGLRPTFPITGKVERVEAVRGECRSRSQKLSRNNYRASDVKMSSSSWEQSRMPKFSEVSKPLEATFS